MQTTKELKPCPRELSPEQTQQFEQDGYLAFSDVLTREEVEAAREALRRVSHELVEDSSSQFSPPKKNSFGKFSGASYRRAHSNSFIQLEAGFDPTGLDAAEIELQVRKFMCFVDEDPIFFRMVSPGSPLRAVVDGLLGSDPVLFQEMALVKPPFVGSEKPWHQDNAYFSVTPLDAVLGVWIALDDADVDNGCMHVIPGGHKEGGFKHHHGTDCEIDPALLTVDKVRPVPIPAGGAMFFYGMLPHETPPNASPKRRRALQFHFRGANTTVLEDSDYDRLFVDRTGTPASCRAASRLGF